MLKRDIGNKGEDIAVKVLKKKGYRIIERNFNSPGMGEIDIVATDGEYLVFIEVRLRSKTDHGTGAETVDIFKQRKLIKAALMYMKRHNLNEHLARFDVVSISGNSEKERQIEIIKNAFGVN